MQRTNPLINLNPQQTSALEKALDELQNPSPLFGNAATDQAYYAEAVRALKTLGLCPKKHALS